MVFVEVGQMLAGIGGVGGGGKAGAAFVDGTAKSDRVARGGAYDLVEKRPYLKIPNMYERTI